MNIVQAGWHYVQVRRSASGVTPVHAGIMVTRTERCACGTKPHRHCPRCEEPVCRKCVDWPCDQHVWPPKPILQWAVSLGPRRTLWPVLDGVRPMLVTLAHTPSSDAGWLYEVKLDGMRTLAYVDDGQVRLLSRRGRCVTDQYPELASLPLAMDARQA